MVTRIGVKRYTCVSFYTACCLLAPPSFLPSSGMDLLSMAQKADKFQEQMDSMKRRMVREGRYFESGCMQHCGLPSVFVLVRAPWRVMPNIGNSSSYTELGAMRCTYVSVFVHARRMHWCLWKTRCLSHSRAVAAPVIRCIEKW